MADLPTIINKAGLVPQAPIDIRNQLSTGASTLSPGLTDRLPGSLVEDVISTDVMAIVLCDSARVETVDSLTPSGANDYLLFKLGQQAGVPIQGGFNTTVDVIFFGAPGTVVPTGLQVSDALYTYEVEDGGIIGTNGESAPLICVAITSGQAWMISPGTVTTITTDLDPDLQITGCVNPGYGNPGSGAETAASYRSRVLLAQRAGGLGNPSYVKTLIGAVPGVDPRLVSIKQMPAGWEVIVGGGADPYLIAYAIFQGMSDITRLVPSQIPVVGITSGANAIVTTSYNHGYANGQKVMVSGIQIGMVGVNSLPMTVVVIDEKSFSSGVDTTFLGAYSGGGYLSPNPRNIAPTIVDYPDSYTVPFVIPPLQVVVISVKWNTLPNNRVSDAGIAALAAPAIAGYINSIIVGQPIILYELESVFKDAVSSILPSAFLTRMQFTVSINGTAASVDPGTGVIAGDPESYFYTSPDGSQIKVSRG